MGELKNNTRGFHTADNQGNTPLHAAAGKGHIESVNTLLKLKADVNCTNNQGDTPLHLAASKGHVEVVKALLQKGAKANFLNSQGKTAKDLATQNGYEVSKMFWTRVSLGSTAQESPKAAFFPSSVLSENGQKALALGSEAKNLLKVLI